MHVTVHTKLNPANSVSIGPDAAEAVRLGFNPSESPRVDRIKALAAALISEFQDLRYNPNAGRHAALAATAAEEAAMWGVKAATAPGVDAAEEGK